jgi:acetylornithine aminotransferase
VKGALIRNLISPIIGVEQVRGKGLLIGICVKENRAKQIAADMQSRGFLVNAASDDVIRIAPAYVVSEKQIMSFVSAFNSSCEEIYRG